MFLWLMRRRSSKFRLLFFSVIFLSVGLLGLAALIFWLESGTGRYWALGLIGGLLAVSLFVQFFMVNRVLKPISTLILETEEILNGIRRKDVSFVGDDELGLLAINFNRLIGDANTKREELQKANSDLATRSEIIEKTDRALNKKIYDLMTLYSIGKDLTSTLFKDQILKIACYTTMGQLGVTIMTILLREDREKPHMIVAKEKGLREVRENSTEVIFTENFISTLQTVEKTLTLEEAKNRPELASDLNRLAPFKAVLIVPLIVKNTVTGMLLLGKKLSREGFTQDEKEFIGTLASLEAIALENARLYEQAITDAMTKLFLKRYFQLRLDDEFKRSERYKGKLSMLMIDIDHFKRINDTYGHMRGDEILIAIANLIRETFRDVDVPCRYGGEEFAVLMPEVSKEEAMVAAERLRQKVDQFKHRVHEQEVTVTISIGVAEYPRDASSAMSLVEVADQALYRSKSNGRNRATMA